MASESKSDTRRARTHGHAPSHAMTCPIHHIPSPQGMGYDGISLLRVPLDCKSYQNTLTESLRRSEPKSDRHAPSPIHHIPSPQGMGYDGISLLGVGMQIISYEHTIYNAAHHPRGRLNLQRGPRVPRAPPRPPASSAIVGVGFRGRMCVADSFRCVHDWNPQKTGFTVTLQTFQADLTKWPAPGGPVGRGCAPKISRHASTVGWMVGFALKCSHFLS